MIVRLLSAALVAGFLAAVVATGLQLALTSPLIVAAERYEGRHTHAAGLSAPLPIVLAHAHEGSEPHGAAPEWQPAEGLPRMAFTGLATLGGGVGYALILGAVMLACGREPSPERGLAFALAGFAR
ncbi:CbtA family protein, partial [Methylobacterium trifolii]